jgi:septum site-determining protein MinD
VQQGNPVQKYLFFLVPRFLVQKQKRIVAVISGKGGVGKSTIAVNTASLLSLRGASTLLIDADVYNPCVSFHLGLLPHPVGLLDVLENKAKIEDALVIDPASGLRCLSASIQLNNKIGTENLGRLIKSLDYDYIIIDCAPGLSSVVEDVIAASNELVILMTPDIPSVTAAMKLISLVKDKIDHTRVHFVLNRVAEKPYELSKREVRTLCQGRLDASIPEDAEIPKSISSKTPAVIHNASAPSSRAISQFSSMVFPEAFHRGAIRIPFLGTIGGGGRPLFLDNYGFR